MKLVINEEFYCQTKRNREPWRESIEKEKETETSFREKEGDK